MVHIQSFGSTEEMVEYLRKTRESVNASLHDAQRALTWGSYWVQFADIDEAHLVWGYVHTREEVIAGERSSGASERQADAVLAHTEADMTAGGLMYGRAHDRFSPKGELGHTHKASAWPIEERLFSAAKDVDFDHRRIEDPAMRLLLEIAYRSARTHAMTLAANQ